jgi:hypothetical protein
MRTALVLFALTLVPSAAAIAQGPGAGPYQRMRMGADDWHARGGHHQNWRDHGGYGGFYDPYFFSPPVIAGSWYQRPYPYHFDYYRYRWGGPPMGDGDYEAEPPYAAPDCPCAVPPQVEVVE